MKNIRKILSILALATVFTLAGCTTTERTLSGVGIGAAVGAGVSGVSGGNVGTGAIVGGVVGGAAGALSK